MEITEGGIEHGERKMELHAEGSGQDDGTRIAEGLWASCFVPYVKQRRPLKVITVFECCESNTVTDTENTT